MKEMHTKCVAGRGIRALGRCSVIAAMGTEETHLFPSEYVLVEVELDLLVGDVDAELLERVPLEVLEAEDVQDADVQALVVFSGGEKKDGIHTF